MATQDKLVGELPGLYGPFSMAERVVQKIWLRRDFNADGARLVDGRVLRIRSPGHWNFLGGPDFKGARLEFDGHEVSGDVEVHFRASDWDAHGHAGNPAFDRVALHVVLFPPAPGRAPTLDHLGRELPMLVLLPLLSRGLEEYAADDALERLTDRDAMERVAELAGRPVDEVAALLHRHARTRWETKRHFAAVRLKRLGWIDASHHAALEVLGYRRNRVPMLATATAHPLGDWAAGVVPEQLMAEQRDAWETHGLRPANHPLARLRQYAQWVNARPDWPERMRAVTAPVLACPAGDDATGPIRRAMNLAEVRQRLSQEVMVGQVGGSRIDTMICDGFLPLVAAATEQDAFVPWFHWFLGDLPDGMRSGLRAVGLVDAKTRPFCHGWGQGLLGWMVERDVRASC